MMTQYAEDSRSGNVKGGWIIIIDNNHCYKEHNVKYKQLQPQKLTSIKEW